MTKNSYSQVFFYQITAMNYLRQDLVPSVMRKTRVSGAGRKMRITSENRILDTNVFTVRVHKTPGTHLFVPLSDTL